MAQYRSAAGSVEGGDGTCMRLIRTPSAGQIAGIVTSHSLVQLWTHFHRGRTVGCSSPDCPGCREQAAVRYEAYFGLYSPATRSHVLIGVPPGPVRQMIDQISRTDRLRGLAVGLTRATKKPNSRIVLTCNSIWPDTSALPAPPDVVRELEKIWGIDHAEEVFSDRVNQAAQDHLDSLVRRAGELSESSAQMRGEPINPEDHVDNDQPYLGGS